MILDFSGRVVVITGVAQGIGRAIARAFKESGAVIHVVDVVQEGLDRARADFGATPHCVDLTDREAVFAMVAEIEARAGHIDVLALAAGGLRGHDGLTFEQIDQENWDRILKGNLDTALWLVQASAPGMIARKYGRVVTISSGAGLRPSNVGVHAYTAAKHGLIGLTRQLSHTLAQHGITVNAIAPGLILSAPTSVRQWEIYGPEGRANFLASTHTRRLGQPEDIAAATLFLASDHAGWITGEVLPVNGGRS